MAPNINLLPHIERHSPGKRWLTIILGIVFALLLGYLIFEYFSLTKSVNSLQDEQKVLQAEKTELESSIVVLEEPKQVNLDSSVKFIESVSYPVSPLLIEINKYVKENTYLRTYIFSENQIQFSVDFETMADIVKYVSDLTASSYFQDVKVEQILSFDPIMRINEEVDTDSFEESDRFSNKFTVIIDPYYLSTGGDVR